MRHDIDTEVLIVGAGPVGVSIANLLGHYGVKVLLIDRSLEVLDYPRAVGLDDEALRTFQAVGLAEAMLQDMIQNVPMRMYTADNRCFAEILPSTREFGWFRRNLFSQPLGEKTLRKGLERYPNVNMQLGVELLAIDQDDDGVTAVIQSTANPPKSVRARYVVGADGARSTVRGTLLKIPYEGQTHAHKWVVIECDHDPLDAPYTALHCEPRRPYVCLRLPYGLRRWEFMLFPGEDGEQMLQPEKVRELLSKHVAKSDRLNVVRARVYTHNSRVAKSFVVGRVCIAGDAAHITPPWIGQGLNAGMRDAFNLSWKLAWIIQGRMKPELLQSYHEERHAHAKAMIELADLFGSVLSQRNRFVAWMRDKLFLSIRHVPMLRDYVLQMKFKPMPRFSTGVVLNCGIAARDAIVGRMFIQPNVERQSGLSEKLDDVVGGRFALLSWRCDPLAEDGGTLQAQLQQLDCVRLVGVRSRSSASEPGMSAADTANVQVIQDLENDLQLWFQRNEVDWVLLRPDRFVAAVGQAQDAPQLLKRFCEMVLLAVPPMSGTGLAPATTPLEAVAQSARLDGLGGGSPHGVTGATDQMLATPLNGRVQEAHQILDISRSHSRRWIRRGSCTVLVTGDGAHRGPDLSGTEPDVLACEVGNALSKQTGKALIMDSKPSVNPHIRTDAVAHSDHHGDLVALQGQQGRGGGHSLPRGLIARGLASQAQANINQRYPLAIGSAKWAESDVDVPAVVNADGKTNSIASTAFALLAPSAGPDAVISQLHKAAAQEDHQLADEGELCRPGSGFHETRSGQTRAVHRRGEHQGRVIA